MKFPTGQVLGLIWIPFFCFVFLFDTLMLFDLSFVTTHSTAMVMSRRQLFTWASLTKFGIVIDWKHLIKYCRCFSIASAQDNAVLENYPVGKSLFCRVWFRRVMYFERVSSYIYLTLPMHWEGFQRIKFRLFSSPTASLSTGTPTRHGWEQIAAHVRLCFSGHMLSII